MMTTIKPLLIIFSILAMPFPLSAEEPTVRIEPPNLQVARQLQEQTASAAIRDYLQSWRSFSSAFAQNRADLLDPDFVGTARGKFTDAIHEQATLGIHTLYLDHEHDIQIDFYSPEGLSIQLIDNVSYDEQVFDHDRLIVTQIVRARYVVVLTPAEVRWRVRIMQTYPQ